MVTSLTVTLRKIRRWRVNDQGDGREEEESTRLLTHGDPFEDYPEYGSRERLPLSKP